MLIDISRRGAIAGLALCSGLLFSLGCGDEETPTDTARDAAHADGSVENAPDAGSDDEEAEPCTPEYPDFKQGISATAGDLTVRLLSIDPTPPRQLMNNDWTIEVVDAAGAPVDDVEITDPRSYMPAHMHGGRKVPVLVKLDKPGQFKLDNIDFRMTGPWQVLMLVKRASDTASAKQAALQLCVK
jgi:hypothetical protein